MEDDMEEGEFMQNVQQYVHASSLYDLSPSILKKARPQTITLASPSAIPTEPLTKIPSEGTLPKRSSTPPPEIITTKPTQSNTSANYVQSLPPSNASSSPVASPAPPAMALREDILQAVSGMLILRNYVGTKRIIEGTMMLKVSRRSSPEKRYFRVVIVNDKSSSQAAPQLVWGKSLDSKSVSSGKLKIRSQDSLISHYSVLARYCECVLWGSI